MSTKSKTSSRRRLADFWKDDAPARHTYNNEPDIMQKAKGIATSKKSTAAYKVKYTIMSKDSKHYLELVIQRILHCWRRKRIMWVMRYFYRWVNITDGIEGSAANAMYKLRDKFEQTLLTADLQDPDDDRLTPEEAEEMMRARWSEKMKAEQERKMKSMQKFIKMWQHKALVPCFHSWSRWAHEIVMERQHQLKNLKGFVRRRASEASELFEHP